jgi:hypothetical protein
MRIEMNARIEHERLQIKERLEREHRQAHQQLEREKARLRKEAARERQIEGDARIAAAWEEMQRVELGNLEADARAKSAGDETTPGRRSQETGPSAMLQKLPLLSQRSRKVGQM